MWPPPLSGPPFPHPYNGGLEEVTSGTPVAQTFLVVSGRREKRRHHSYLRLWGLCGNGPSVGLGTPEASGEARAGTGVGRSCVRTEQRAGGRSENSLSKGTEETSEETSLKRADR